MLTLITNVEFAQEDSARFHARAILIQPPSEHTPLIGPPRVRVRGFGVDAAQPVFTIFLKTENAEYEIDDAYDPTAVMLSDDGSAKPIFAGATLKVGEWEAFLQVSDATKPFSVEQFEDDAWDAIWETLQARVAEFWVPPQMPVMKWMPSAAVRDLLGRVRA